MNRMIWRDEHIFAAPDCPTIDQQFADAEPALHRLECLIAELAHRHEPAALRALLRAIRAQTKGLTELAWNSGVYGYNLLSRNGQDEAAKTLLSRSTRLSSRLAQVTKPVTLFWLEAAPALVETLLQDPELFELAHQVRHQRELQDQQLSLACEQLLEGLAVDGLQAWGELYDSLVAKLMPQIAGECMGLAQASNLLSHPQQARRKAAWFGIRAAWEEEQDTVAAILNAINGWRLELARQRGGQRQLDALDLSCHQSQISRQTLDTLLSVTRERRTLGQRALKGKALALGLRDYGPWDLYAPAPVSEPKLIGFEQAITLIAEIFAEFDPEMGAFVLMMAERGWIDAAPSEHRRSGAYSTEYAHPAEPRVFITYEGTVDNLTTLAHELGHAWHSWLLRDLPLEQRDYPMTLAETASLFAEILVRDALFERSQEVSERRNIASMDADSAASLLVDVPARFEFELSLVAARREGYVGASQLRSLMKSAMEQWYGDSLSRHDDLFWASKGHFSISEVGFYNYPYLFGYLFALSLYAQKVREGSGFAETYRALLTDTGRMSAEDLIAKHLGVDIREPDFWHESLNYVEEGVERFERLI
ncbi:M3 family oligoendopeptidase [Aeromonas rivuli]|uniref:M3 family oligoendopeptidase n=1 Tax=Aeromonas rivuli TaxID=648794 RepID=UPI0005A67542|nr:M3 family oligoendopeptidase [Aeromonas rivuli]